MKHDVLCGAMLFTRKLNQMHLDQIDLNLLRLFHRLWGERSVRGAALRLGVTPSAVSHGLTRLRRVFDDPLFVRSGSVMLPTPQAAKLATLVGEVLTRLESELFAGCGFTPSSAALEFRIALSDMSEMVMLPALLQALAQQAPGCALRSQRLAHDAVEDALESGAVDLAIGYVFKPRRNSFQQTLYEHDFRVVAWDRHPRLGPHLDKLQYEAERHLVAEVGSDEHLQHALQTSGIQRRVAVRVGGLLSLPWLLPESELIATVPSHLARAAAGRFPLRYWPLPLPVAPYAIKSTWHTRLQGDEAHRWFRELVYETLRHYPEWHWDTGDEQPALNPRKAVRKAR